MMKKLLALVCTMGATSLGVGCSAEAGQSPVEEVGEVSQALVCSGESKYKTEAGLAAAVAIEIGRWESHLDFWMLPSGGLALTQAALDRCAARGYPGCPNVSAILKLQWYGAPEIPGHYPDQFRNILVAHYQEYMSFYQNNALPLTEVVDLDYVTSNTEACDDGDGTYEMHWYAVDLPDDKLHLLKWKLAAYGSRPANPQPENPFLNFSVSEGLVGIDPTNFLVYYPVPYVLPICYTAPVVIAQPFFLGKCCVINNQYGTYKHSGWDNITYVCVK